MGKIKLAAEWMIGLATDDSHGYDQIHRWGPDYDCSSAIITAWEQAGVPVKSKGASYTGNMYSIFRKCGFLDVTGMVNLSSGYGLQYGDVLLNTVSHTAMYIGNNQIVHASINEKGSTVGGVSGDQTGREICIRSYYNKPWDYVLRFSEEHKESNLISTGQIYANIFLGTDIAVDGMRGTQTMRAGIMVLQKAMNLDYRAGLAVDGVWGEYSSETLGEHYVEYGERQYLVTAAEILLLLKGYDSGGVEFPGIFAGRLREAVWSFQKQNAWKTQARCDRKMFLMLIA